MAKRQFPTFNSLEFVELIPTGVLVVSRSGEIIRVNRQTEAIFRRTRDELIGASVETLLPAAIREHHERFRTDFLADPQPRMMGHRPDLTGVAPDGTEFPVEIALNPVTLEGQFVILCLVTDVSARRAIEDENRRLLEELRAALAEVKRLSGLLPICASCKKIRDPQGRWQAIEEYVTSHSEAEFSHGICPECAKKLYSEYL